MPTDPQQPKRPTPRGTVKKLTDAELDKLADITPEDIADAQSAWRRDAPAQFTNLLDAEPDDGPPEG